MSTVYFFLIIFNYLIFKNLNTITSYLNFYDIPDKRKIHSQKVSKIGGVIVYLNILLYFLLASIFHLIALDLNLLIFLSSIFFVNLYNDKKDISPILRLFICYVIFLTWSLFDNNLIIDNLYFEFIDLNISLGKYSYIITPLFFIIFLNALNLFDGVNLQSITYIFLFFIFFIFNKIDISNYLYLLIFAIFFSIYNYNNKIFLGDSGISVFATLITYITITNYNQSSNFLLCEEIFAIMFLPGIDMLRLFFYRVKNKKNPFNPDKNHLHHHILQFIPAKYVFFYQLFFNFVVLLAMYVLNLSYYITLTILIIFYTSTLLITYEKKTNL